MKKVFFSALFLFGIGVLSSQAQHVRARIDFPVSIHVGPEGRPPHEGYVWVGPEWQWRHGRYVAAPGYWAHPHNRGGEWIPGHWVTERHGDIWVRGHWR